MGATAVIRGQMVMKEGMEERNEVNGGRSSVAFVDPASCSGTIVGAVGPAATLTPGATRLIKSSLFALIAQPFDINFLPPPPFSQNECSLAWRLSWQAGYIGSGKPCNSTLLRDVQLLQIQCPKTSLALVPSGNGVAATNARVPPPPRLERLFGLRETGDGIYRRLSVR